MNERIVVGRGQRGPILSGNGGYVGGLLAKALGEEHAVEVTYRAPVPLEMPLDIVRDGADRLRLMHADTLICEARRAELAFVPEVPAIDWSRAERIWSAGGSHAGSAFAGCIVCGRERAEGDGLRVWGGPTGAGGESWSVYHPHAAHAGADGRIGFEYVWGTLDCPGAWAAQDPDDWRPALTGRMTARIVARPKAGERCLVVGRRTGVDGRKLHSTTALYTESGTLCAVASQTWIVLKEDTYGGALDKPPTTA